jgi:DNA-binding NarL/FixJ family response regulator
MGIPVFARSYPLNDNAKEQTLSQGKVADRPAWALVDDLMLRSRVTALARDAGFATRYFAAPDALVAALAQGPPALLIVDVSDRRGKGLVLLERLAAAAPGHPRPPILAFYAHTDLAVRKRAEALGVDRIVPRSAFVVRFAELAKELAG